MGMLAAAKARKIAEIVPTIGFISLFIPPVQPSWHVGPGDVLALCSIARLNGLQLFLRCLSQFAVHLAPAVRKLKVLLGRTPT